MTGMLRDLMALFVGMAVLGGVALIAVYFIVDWSGQTWLPVLVLTAAPVTAAVAGLLGLALWVE